MGRALQRLQICDLGAHLRIYASSERNELRELVVLSTGRQRYHPLDAVTSTANR